MRKVTIESTMNSDGAPTELETFAATGGLFTLKVGAARELMAAGCKGDTIVYGEPKLVEGRWTIKATGDKP